MYLTPTLASQTLAVIGAEIAVEMEETVSGNNKKHLTFILV
jgi:hypothetical protein